MVQRLLAFLRDAVQLGNQLPIFRKQGFDFCFFVFSHLITP